MSDAFQGYLTLSSSQRVSSEALPALSRLLQALSQGQEPTTEQRRRLITTLLSSAPSSSSYSTPPPPTSDDNVIVPPLCSVLKFLGRSPAGTEELARENGIKTLLELGGLKRVADIPRYDSKLDPNSDETDDQDDEGSAASIWAQRERDLLEPHEAEALRCLCNVLMLHPSARDVFPTVVLADENRSAVKGMLRILGCSGAGFLGGRLLFMLTSKPSEAVTELVLGGDIVDILQEYANRYLIVSKSPSLAPSLTSPPTPSPADILKEHLKVAYNLMLQYGRISSTTPTAVAQEKKKRRFWPKKDKSHSLTSDQAEEIEKGMKGDKSDEKPETSRSKSPLAMAKRVVGAVKSSSQSSPSLGPTSPPTVSSTRFSKDQTATRKNSIETADEGNSSSDSLSLTSAQLFLPLFRPYLSLAVTLPLHPSSSSPKDPNPIVRSALNTLLNFPIELEELDGSETSWIQYIPPRTDKDGISLRLGGIGSLGERLLELLETTCNAYFPVDSIPPTSEFTSNPSARSTSPPCHPDDWIPTGQGEASKIEEILGPVMLLLRKLSMIGEANEMFRFVVFPPNVDRSKPIDKHPTLAGHLVRILTSVFLPTTAFGVGEFLYNLAERSPEELCSLIGYGNASGFLQNRGELVPPPPPVDPSTSNGSSSMSSESSRAINPITGAYEPEPDPNYKPMNEEEKEREAEKLYTLFGRMSRTGVMSAANPVHEAKREGRFEETSEERERELERLRKEDEDLEKEVERDMADFRARRRAVK